MFHGNNACTSQFMYISSSICYFIGMTIPVHLVTFTNNSDTKKILPRRSLFFIVVLGMLIISGNAVSASDSYTYSIMHISDTQKLSESYPSTLSFTFSYLESIKSTFNISGIIITGDLVDEGDNVSQWTNYVNARSMTTIPIYEVSGNHDKRADINISYYPELVENKKDWTSEINDFVFIGIGYTKEPLSGSDIAYYTSVIESYPQKFSLIATHNYFDRDLTLSPLGNSIRNNLVLKPTIVMSGHVHDSLIRTGFVHNIPYIEDLTDFQDFGDFSAGKLYTVYISDGNVTKITVREAYIFPYHYLYPERIVYQMPIDGLPNSPTVYPTKSWIYPDASPTVYPTKSWIYPNASPTVYPTKSWIYPDASPTVYPTKSWIYPNASPTVYPTKSPILYLDAAVKIYPNLLP